MMLLKSIHVTIKTIAASACQSCAKPVFGLIFALGLVAGCSVVDKPTRAALYDFGPGELPTQAAATPAPALPPLAIADIATSGGALDNQAVLYRLGYLDAQQLRPYSQARWSMPPAQLLRQRLRERLGQQRAVFNAREGVALNRSQNANLLMLRLELEEFSQLFSAPDASVGLIRLHATLVEITPAGERLVAQRNLSVQRPATRADAAGGVRALTAATDAAIDELDQWLRQMPAR
ncbi:ABC-type transport auxiliary lipoprotein family protein [Polaromonas naphthalenivorans]|uniref:Putative lipoprotein n=1 Tax=Polaromonas naphthalenivorans (strain CJ2) TaxID=365044 RepID=A1VIN2_POLNA|nr:ABC-type transport auxiliary lipoprotein family protein [Polaromonas naphthalenivorans]ABM35510.1 putative lipoprotein [Polaromonas naphthalenivorans CJ2]